MRHLREQPGVLFKKWSALQIGPSQLASDIKTRYQDKLMWPIGATEYPPISVWGAIKDFLEIFGHFWQIFEQLYLTPKTIIYPQIGAVAILLDGLWVCISVV